MLRVAASALSLVLAGLLLALPARADQLMTRFAGEWLGTGQLLFGPQYGAKFDCQLVGDPSESLVSFDMRGRCWMGGLSAPVTARLRYNDQTGQYYGEFLDGADGQGADIVGARDGEGISLRLMRGALQGRLTAETVNGDQMKVMLFYRDIPNNRDLPIVAMGFARRGTKFLPDYLPDFATGSITPKN